MSLFRYVDRWATTLYDHAREAFPSNRENELRRLTELLEDRDLDLERHLATFQQDWIEAGLASPWANYGGGWAPAAYRFDGTDAEVRGLVGGGTEGTAIMVLPPGYRPAGNHMYATVVGIVPHTGWGYAARLDVLSTGEVRAFWGAGTAAFLSINCRFSTLVDPA